MKYIIVLFAVIFFAGFYSQNSDSDIDRAYGNAKKGIYWALANIPEKKTRITHQLVAEDKLYATVKLQKKVNGVKVESTGYFNTAEVTVVMYKSTDSLLSQGYIKDRKIMESEK